MEVVWMVEVILAQTSPGTAFLSIATKDPAWGLAIYKANLVLDCNAWAF